MSSDLLMMGLWIILCALIIKILLSYVPDRFELTLL